MMRSAFLLWVPAAALVVATTAIPAQNLPPEDARRATQASADGIPHADLGNGYFRNPVLVHGGGDITVLRVGEDFYMIAGRELLWHSRDLVNWRPLARVSGVGGAGDLIYHQGKYYIYTIQSDASLVDPRYEHLTRAQRTLLGTTSRTGGNKELMTFVTWATDPAGPWSPLTDVGFYGLLDPGHVVDDQSDRFLMHAKGTLVRLSPDGLTAVGDVTHVYDGWPIPENWVFECHCLEAPKFSRHGGYYYLSSAQGGTAGPTTAHMGVIARSRSVTGPWENSPYNPMVRTNSQEEKWWRQGHGTLIDDVSGNWWFVYTGFENGFTELSKQTLLLPVEWTEDGWPRIVPGVSATDVLPMPAGENVGHGMPLSDDFTASEMGIQWTYGPRIDPAEAFRFGDGRLTMAAGGDSPGSATALSVTPVNHAYEVEVEVAIPATAEGGLMVGGENGATAGLRMGEAFAYWPRVPNAIPWTGNRIFVRIRNDRGDVSCYYSVDGERWTQFENSTSVSGARSVSLYAAGEGEVVFRGFKYRGLD